MKIPLGGDAYLEPDEGPRDSPFHRRIVVVERLEWSRSAHKCALDCGHQVFTFGNLAKAGGVVLCTQCRDIAERARR